MVWLENINKLDSRHRGLSERREITTTTIGMVLFDDEDFLTVLIIV